MNKYIGTMEIMTSEGDVWLPVNMPESYLIFVENHATGVRISLTDNQIGTIPMPDGTDAHILWSTEQNKCFWSGFIPETHTVRTMYKLPGLADCIEMAQALNVESPDRISSPTEEQKQ